MHHVVGIRAGVMNLMRLRNMLKQDRIYTIFCDILMVEDEFLCLMFDVAHTCVYQSHRSLICCHGRGQQLLCFRRRVIISNNQIPVKQMTQQQKHQYQRRELIVEARMNSEITWYNKFQWRECVFWVRGYVIMPFPRGFLYEDSVW